MEFIDVKTYSFKPVLKCQFLSLFILRQPLPHLQHIQTIKTNLKHTHTYTHSHGRIKMYVAKSKIQPWQLWCAL